MDTVVCFCLGCWALLGAPGLSPGSELFLLSSTGWVDSIWSIASLRLGVKYGIYNYGKETVFGELKNGEVLCEWPRKKGNKNGGVHETSRHAIHLKRVSFFLALPGC